VSGAEDERTLFATRMRVTRDERMRPHTLELATFRGRDGAYALRLIVPHVNQGALITIKMELLSTPLLSVPFEFDALHPIRSIPNSYPVLPPFVWTAIRKQLQMGKRTVGMERHSKSNVKSAASLGESSSGGTAAVERRRWKSTITGQVSLPFTGG
jgi:hypothetical protein